VSERDGEDVMDDMAWDRLQFYRTAGLAGLKIIPDDKCCRLLAWLYVYGGGNEQVLNPRVSDMIFYAQGRLNLLDGETPKNVDLLPVLQGYIKSLPDENYNNPPEWVIELEKEYGIKPYRE
jgi:hypothetical protein